MRKFLPLLLLVAVLLPAASMQARGRVDAYEKLTFVSSRGDTLRYRLLRPEQEVPGKRYPVVLFMHGAGERGNDNTLQLFHGGQMWLNPATRAQYPAYVLVPQCPKEYFWAYDHFLESFMPYDMPILDEPTPMIVAVKELLDSYLAMPSADLHRVYVMGLSMGAMATYDLAIRYPDTFAAAIPICGSVHPDRLKAVKKGVHFRIIHGDADPTVPVEGSRTAYRTLRAAGIDAAYIEMPGTDHNSWTPAFNRDDFMPWLFKQKR